MSDPQMLPLDLPEPAPVVRCWYCGAAAGVLEVEHQLPRSRGGADGANTVSACAPCNDLKGPLSLEEFRRGLGERLGTEVVFAGEATSERPATPLAGRVRSLGGDRSVVRLDPTVGEELQAAWRYLRSSESTRLTRLELASACITAGLADMRDERDLGDEWPEPTLALFEAEQRRLTGRNDLSRMPRVPMPRQHTKVPGELLDWARAGVEHRRANGEPELALLDWITEALRAQLASDAERFPGYPKLDEALRQRYGGAQS